MSYDTHHPNAVPFETYEEHKKHSGVDYYGTGEEYTESDFPVHVCVQHVCAIVLRTVRLRFSKKGVLQCMRSGARYPYPRVYPLYPWSGTSTGTPRANGRVHFRSGTGTGMGGNIEEAGGYGYKYKYEYKYKYSYKYEYEHGW